MKRSTQLQTQTIKMASTPQDVMKAVNMPNFSQNHDQFWQMLNFLFTQYNDEFIHTQLDTQTFRKIICQLHQVVEDTTDYDIIIKNSELIYHVYFVALASIRGGRTNSEMHGYETPEVLRSLYQTYRLLLKFERYNLPCFGHLRS